ncbi:MAG: 30S ribosomal protein S2 [Alphaproteobacteria bacterium]|nr:30S ribosomal protein S2 [Alphaproteobacteria bacterium]NCQ66832.1 30S ribosomal protein S2 [Alphaproteobacteria bacterium]NCT07400.1 30S ribosomal protein S2 [Alphaproteobacteria bacterium]
MTLPTFTMRELLQAGVHFGHHPRRWNPKMDQYLFGVRNDIHIINLERTVPLLQQALQAVHDVVKSGGKVLFVGTKRQASPLVSEYAERCGQYYVNHRWLGGMMTNYKTVKQSIQRLKEHENTLERASLGLTKKEILKLERSRNNLTRSLGGIREMGGTPDILVVLDTNKEKLAIHEAKTLGIPVISILDSNSNPDNIDFPIPGNDDAIRSLELYLRLISDAALSGMKQQMAASGVDLGSSAELPDEALALEMKATTAPAESSAQNA